MDITRILLDLAIILLFTKLFGLVAKKLGLPQVLGALVAGLLVGPAIWSPITGDAFVPVSPSDGIKVIAEIGVIMLMFNAGLETDLKELRNCGLKATIIALFGVLVPLGLGFAIAIPFFGLNGTENIIKCVFVGVIITATSVSITVETLRELGKLKGKVGTVVLSAAIIDDVIGIIILTFVTGLKDPSQTRPYMVIVNTVLFFVVGIGVGVGLNFLFRWLAKKYPHKRRVPIFGLVVCFVYAFCASKFFGIADITGAYLAGIMLSNIKETGYIERKIDVSSYMIFSPVFFANIGIETSFAGFKPQILLFCLLFVLAGLLGKVLGCGLAAKACRFGWRDSAKIGVGMMARGEVALVVATKGISANILPSLYLTPVIFLVLISSLLTPILLKVMFGKEKPELPQADTVGELVPEGATAMLAPLIDDKDHPFSEEAGESISLPPLSDSASQSDEGTQ